jgi:hypothetical protein
VAANYVTTGSRASVKTLDGQTVIDVEAIGIVTRPSGIRFTVPVAKTVFEGGGAGGVLDQAASVVEGLAQARDDTGARFITGGSGNQQIDANGLLAYFITFVVSYTPTSSSQGTFSTTVTMPVAVFETVAAYEAGIDGVQPLVIIERAYNLLKHTAAA